jgi:TatD DNase family protein
LAKLVVDLGLYVSFSGIITFKNAENVREAAKIVPLERILVETDAPFLAPGKYRGQRNEPAYVRLTAEKIAEIKGVTLEEIEKATTANFHRLFNRVPAAK